MTRRATFTEAELALSIRQPWAWAILHAASGRKHPWYFSKGVKE